MVSMRTLKKRLELAKREQRKFAKLEQERLRKEREAEKQRKKVLQQKKLLKAITSSTKTLKRRQYKGYKSARKVKKVLTSPEAKKIYKGVGEFLSGSIKEMKKRMK